MVSDRTKKRQAEREAAWRKKAITRDDMLPILEAYHNEYISPLMYRVYTPWYVRWLDLLKWRVRQIKAWWGARRAQ